MSIRDISKVMQKPGQKTYGNAVEAELASLNAGLQRAIKNDDKTLIEFYTKKIEKLKSANQILNKKPPKKKTNRYGKPKSRR
jgi:hypothetical protein